jgi:AcrR family transcriptional regulator
MPATKDDIATEFMALAFRYGYRRTSIDDVARALRISKATVYEHFASKEALLAEAVSQAARAQRRRVEERLTGRTAVERATQVIAIALADVRAFYASNPHPGMAEPAEMTERVNAEVYEPMVRDIVAAGVASGELDVPDVDLAAGFVMAIGMEAVRRIRLDPASRPEAAMTDAVLRMLARSPAAPSGAAIDARATARTHSKGGRA